MLPHTPCRQFYISHLHNQPWVQVGSQGHLRFVMVFLWVKLDSAGACKSQAGGHIAHAAAGCKACCIVLQRKQAFFCALHVRRATTAT